MVLYSLTSSMKREIRQFHVVVVQQRQKKIYQKKHCARAEFCFVNPNLTGGGHLQRSVLGHFEMLQLENLISIT